MKELDQIIALSEDPSHFLMAFHMNVVSAEKDRSRLTAPIQESICNNFGSPHGGFYMTLCDIAATLAAFTDGRCYVTQNANFQFLGNPHSNSVIVEGTVLHRGKTVTSVRAEVTDESGRLICEGLFSMFAVQKQFSDSK